MGLGLLAALADKRARPGGDVHLCAGAARQLRGIAGVVGMRMGENDPLERPRHDTGASEGLLDGVRAPGCAGIHQRGNVRTDNVRMHDGPREQHLKDVADHLTRHSGPSTSFLRP